MGNQVSGPEKVYRAAKNNNIQELQDLVQRISNANFDEPTRRTYFEFKDGEGRTPLLLAASKNYHNIAKVLLEQGADVAVQTARANGGTPLHEAVYQRHEAMVELLLQHGANPFVENLHSRTAMDLAIASGNVNIIRHLEKKAIFSGYINLKVLTYNGFSNSWKDRHCVVMPRYENPPPIKSISGSTSSAAVPPVVVRKQLWIYKDAGANVPRTRLWLDGATAFVIGGGGKDGVIRLHPNHEEPTRMFTKYDRGHMLFCEPARAMGGSAHDALAAFQTFISACNGPAPPPQFLGLAGVAGRSSAAAPQAAPPPPPPPAPQLQAPRPAFDEAAVDDDPASGWAVVPPPAAAAQQQQPPRRHTAEALPGETDEEYARRLARTWADASGAPPPPPPAADSSPANPFLPAGSPAASEPGAEPTAPPYFSPLTAALQGSPAGAPYGRQYAYSEPPPARPDWGAQPPAGRATSYAAASRVPAAANMEAFLEAARAEAAAAPQHARLHSVADTVVVHPGPNSSALLGDHGGHSRMSSMADPAGCAQHSRMGSIAEQQVPPSRYPQVAIMEAGGNPFSGGGRLPARDESLGEGETCVICLTAGREVGLLHGATVHMCVCKGCAPLLAERQPCPMCRQPIERIIGVY